MATFTLASVNAKEAWSVKYFKEYVNQSGLLPYMSNADNAIIRINTDLKSAGDLVHIPYITSLKGAGVSGSATLEGNEENLGNYSVAIRVGHIRNGVIIPESESFKTELNFADHSRTGLKNWSAEKLRSDLLTAMQSVAIAQAGLEDTYKAFSVATAGEKNAMLTANVDRTLFGGAPATAPSNFATSAAVIDATKVLTAKTVSAAKDMAETSANYRINPYMDKQGEKWFVMFVDATGFRQLQDDEDIKLANRDARPRDVKTNPIFTGADLVYDGVIIKKIPEMPVIGAIGASGHVVRFAALCGGNALGVAFSQKPAFRTETKDYGHLVGVGITEIRGQTKMTVNSVQLGMVSVYHG